MLSQKKKTRIVGCPFGYQGELFIHSKNILHRDIHSVQHIQDHVHSILYTNKHQPWAQPHAVHSILHTNKHQHQPWAQPHAFHNSYILVHVHSIHHSQDHVRNIHHTGMAQHQPWAQLQPHAFHNSYIQDRVHSIHYSQDHVRNIHHKGMAQLQPHAFHNKNILVHGTQNSQGVPAHTRDILRTEGRGQHQPWAWPRAQQ